MTTPLSSPVAHGHDYLNYHYLAGAEWCSPLFRNAFDSLSIHPPLNPALRYAVGRRHEDLLADSPGFDFTSLRYPGGSQREQLLGFLRQLPRKAGIESGSRDRKVACPFWFRRNHNAVTRFPFPLPSATTAPGERLGQKRESKKGCVVVDISK